MIIVKHFSMDPLYTAVYSLSISIIAWITWLLFYRPYNLVKDYTEYGYDKIDCSHGSKIKRNLVNLLLKRRKVGNLPPPYPNSWYSILESDKLRPQQAKEIYVLGQNLVVWRGEESGQVFAADAYCPHLGAHLGVGSTVKGNCIQCPFHQWSFDGCRNGAVADVPYTKQQTSFEKLPGLKSWRVVEANGTIWIWFHDQNMEPTWFPEEIIKTDENTKWKFRGRFEIQTTCHIQEIVENTADASHVQAVHGDPAIFSVRFPKLTKFFEKIIRHRWQANWTSNDNPNYKHESAMDFLHHLEFFGGKMTTLHVQIKGQVIGAGMIIIRIKTPIGKALLIHSVTPIEPLLQRITHRLYTERKFIHPLALLFLHGEVIQMSRDVEVWNRKYFMKSPNLVKEEHNIKLFRMWFSQFYSSYHEEKQVEQNYLRNGDMNKFEF